MTVDREGLARVIREAPIRATLGAGKHVDPDATLTSADYVRADACLAYICEQAGDVGDLVERLREVIREGSAASGAAPYDPERYDKTLGRLLDCSIEAADRLSTLSAALALVTRERDEARAQVDACAEYLKPGETPAERIKREHDDCCSLMEMLAKDRERRDAAEGQVSALTAENERLREALTLFRDFGCPVCSGDCASANPPVIACPMQSARAALTPGRGADESGEAGA